MARGELWLLVKDCLDGTESVLGRRSLCEHGIAHLEAQRGRRHVLVEDVIVHVLACVEAYSGAGATVIIQA